MFYSHDILARKGPLGTIWIAAHLDRKLRKNQVLETDITVSVEAILSADLQKVLALRLSGHLLLGITRIFNRKVNYLYENCETALDKLKQAYKKGNVDLPKEQAVARYEDVTLPDQYVLPDLDAYSEIYATPLLTKKGDKYRGKPEELVIVEKVVANPFDTFDDDMLEPSQDLNFGGPVDGPFPTPEVPRSAPDATDDPFADQFDGGSFFDPEAMDVEKNRSAPTPAGLQPDEEAFPAIDDTFDAPTPLEKVDDTERLDEQDQVPLADMETQPTPAQGRDSLDALLNGDTMLPTPVGEDLLTPAAGVDGTVGKRTPKRRKVDRVIFDQETVIPGAEMDRRIKNPGDLVRPRKRAAHTERQIRLQINSQAGLEALLHTPAVSGLGPELQAVVRGMLVKGKPDLLPLTEEAEERLASAKKQKEDAETKTAEEEEKSRDKETEEEKKGDEVPAEVAPEPSPTENGTAAATPHEDFPMGGTDEFPPTEDHYDHSMPDGNWADGDTAPHPPATPTEEVTHKEKQAAGYPGLEDLLTGKTPGGEDAVEGGEDATEGETPSQDVSASGGVKGWSVRTRGVANRLQQVFREGGEEKSVPLEGLLAGYGRKTAAKMFFEVLVLKTSNFIDVKQEEPFGNVDLAPTPQLMAAAF